MPAEVEANASLDYDPANVRIVQAGHSLYIHSAAGTIRPFHTKKCSTDEKPPNSTEITCEGG